MNEQQIEKYLVTEFKKLGAEVRKLKFIGQQGAPDRLIMFKGMTVFAEVKAPGKKLKPHQEREIKRMRDAGQDVWVIDSIAKVDALVQEYANIFPPTLGKMLGTVFKSLSKPDIITIAK